MSSPFVLLRKMRRSGLGFAALFSARNEFTRGKLLLGPTGKTTKVAIVTVLSFVSSFIVYTHPQPISTGYDVRSAWISWALLLALCLVGRWSQSKTEDDDASQLLEKGTPQSLDILQRKSDSTIQIVSSALVVAAGLFSASPLPKCWLPFVVAVTSAISLFTPPNPDLTQFGFSEVHDGTAFTSKRGLFNPWSLTRLCYNVVVGAFIAWSIYKDSDAAEYITQMLLTAVCVSGAYITLTYLAKRNQPEDPITTNTSNIFVCDLPTFLASTSLAISTLLVFFTESGSKYTAVTIIVSVFQAIQWASVYQLTVSASAVVSSTSQLAALGLAQAYEQHQYSISSNSSLIFISAIVMCLVARFEANRVPKKIVLPLMAIPILVGTASFIDGPGIWKAELHPIELLHAQGKERYNDMVSGQSKTVEEAIIEYRRRYSRDPPRGFDVWAQLALDEGLMFIDEFDGMTKSFEPFRQFEPAVLTKYLEDVQSLDLDELVVVKIENGIVNATNDKFWAYHGELLRDWLTADARYDEILPDVTVLLNTFDEPKVVLDPFDTRLGLEEVSHVEIIDLGQGNPWSNVTVGCSDQLLTRRLDAVTTRGNTMFVSDLSQSQDICAHPEYRKLHAFFNRPASLRLTHFPVPLWSQARSSSFQDIMYPSPFYEAHRGDYIAEKDSSWESKHASLYWRGATTGGYNTPDNWEDMHRQRMVLSTIPQTGPHNITLLKKAPLTGAWEPYATTSDPGLQNLFETSISSVLQCEEETCDKLRAVLPAEGVQPDTASYDHKYVLDMDGNGFSGRYYRILRSRSAVIKQTLLKEWHDDWLVPWYHYVPLSIKGDEIWEVMRFFGTAKGDEIGAAIAGSSSEWTERNLREVDIELVTLRLLLEYGSLFNR